MRLPQTLLPLNECIEAISRLRQSQEASPLTKPVFPRVLLQYWDRNPPDEIQRLLERNRSLCKRHKIEYALFDDVQARAFLAAHSPPEMLAAYEASPHPAMKCDLFRLCYLYEKGGYYLDADMVLADKFIPLMDLAGELLAFQWDSPERVNACNWLMASTARSEPMRFIMEATAGSIVQALESGPEFALKQILGVSGPGIFTRALGTWIAENTDSPQRITVATVARAYRWVHNGPKFLNQPLAYKKTSLHWLHAQNAEANPTASPSPTTATPPAKRWWQKLLGR